jgi:hypothetical protein
MKRAFTIAFVLLLGIAFVSTTCFARSKAPPEKVTPEKAPAPKRQVISGFVGKVTMVDANLIQVKVKKEAVTFDASNPELEGYKGMSDVIVGDIVAVKYKKDGIMITKMKGRLGEKKVEKAKKTRPEKVSEKRAPKKTAAKSKASGFLGTVTMVYSNLIDVWGKKGEVVTFDASNPELEGYKDINDVIVGDTVAIAYTKTGILIKKLKGITKAKVFEEEKKTEDSNKSVRQTVVTRITCTGKGPCAVSVDKPTD